MKTLTKQMIKNIREMQDIVNFSKVSKEYYITEDFIEEFNDKINWGYICLNRELSDKFVIKFLNEVQMYWEYLIAYQNLQTTTLLKLKPENRNDRKILKKILTHNIVGSFKDRYCDKCNLTTNQVLSRRISCEQALMEKVLNA